MFMILLKSFIHLMILAFFIALIASYYLRTPLGEQFKDLALIFTVFAIIDWFSITLALAFAVYEALRYYYIIKQDYY